jgi:hypothetical protein
MVGFFTKRLRKCFPDATQSTSGCQEEKKEGKEEKNIS